MPAIWPGAVLLSPGATPAVPSSSVEYWGRRGSPARRVRNTHSFSPSSLSTPLSHAREEQRRKSVCVLAVAVCLLPLLAPSMPCAGEAWLRMPGRQKERGQVCGTSKSWAGSRDRLLAKHSDAAARTCARPAHVKGTGALALGGQHDAHAICIMQRQALAQWAYSHRRGRARLPDTESGSGEARSHRRPFAPRCTRTTQDCTARTRQHSPHRAARSLEQPASLPQRPVAHIRRESPQHHVGQVALRRRVMRQHLPGPGRHGWTGRTSVKGSSALPCWQSSVHTAALCGLCQRGSTLLAARPTHC